MKSVEEAPGHLIASEILRLVPCDRIAFAVPLPDGSGFRVTPAHPDPSAFAEFEVPARGSCSGHVISTRHAQLLSAIGEESHFAEEEPLYRAGVRDAAFIPLFLGGEVQGVAIVGRTEVNSLEPRSVRCLEKVSGLLAVALAAERGSTASASDPSGLVPYALRIPQEEDLDRVCRDLLEAVRECTPFHRVVLTLLDAEMKSYQWFFTGFTEAEIEEFHGNPIRDEGRREIFNPQKPVGPVAGWGGRIYIPLIGLRESPLGFLSIDPPEPEGKASPGHLAFVRMMAVVVAATLERNHLFTEFKRERNRLQKTQEQLLHSEKLSAIGQLVSGVAHELNNPLAGVVGFAELVLRSNTDPKIARDLQRIVNESQRCQHIVQNLLNFARRTKAERRAIDLNEIVENVLDLRSYQLRLDNVKVRTELAPDLPRTAGDYHQIQQVLLNIINNAHQAMQEVASERILALRTGVEEGRIVVRIEDTGPGISSSKLGRVFEPFYTTKVAGKGTGLGLSLSLGIVRDHGGQIRVESVVGKGSTFSVELPVHDVHDEAPVPKPEAAPEMTRSSRSILVVDDEEVIVDLLNEVLVSAGHRVETARDGKQALRKILAEAYDAVISDLKMPGMDGAGLYDAVCREKPEMACRFVFSTGDLASPMTQEFFRKTGCPYLMKPFDLNVVRDTVERLFSPS